MRPKPDLLIAADRFFIRALREVKEEESVRKAIYASIHAGRTKGRREELEASYTRQSAAMAALTARIINYASSE